MKKELPLSTEPKGFQQKLIGNTLDGKKIWEEQDCNRIQIGEGLMGPDTRFFKEIFFNPKTHCYE